MENTTTPPQSTLRPHQQRSRDAVSDLALRAFNARKEAPCFNEDYNAAHKLGTRAERLLLDRIATSKWGLMRPRGARIARRDVDDHFIGNR